MIKIVRCKGRGTEVYYINEDGTQVELNGITSLNINMSGGRLYATIEIKSEVVSVEEAEELPDQLCNTSIHDKGY